MMFPDREGGQTFSFGSPDTVQKPYWTFRLGVVDANGLLDRLTYLHWSCGLFGSRSPADVIGSFAAEYRLFSWKLVEE